MGCELHNYLFKASHNFRTNAERKTVKLFLCVLDADFCIGISNAFATYGFRKIYRHEFKGSGVPILNHGLFIFK
jgi:hypothetical protein